MDQVSILPLSVQIRNLSRSMGLKLLVVCSLALLMTIPSLFVNSVVKERTIRAKGVIEEISGRAGGQQTFLGPSLSIPYSLARLGRTDWFRLGLSSAGGVSWLGPRSNAR